MPRRIVSPTGKPVRLAPVRPNAGIRRNYQARIDRLVGEMHRSLLYWLSAAYRATPPEALALDASPAATLQAAFRKLARRWQRRFDKAGPQLTRYFAQAVKDRSERDLAATLKQAGITVEFKMTRAVQDAYSAVIGEQVGLIRSIASEHLAAVEGLVMRSVQQGRNLGPLTKEIKARYGLSRKRAALIARDQNNKASATITKTRQQGLGLTRATWLHSTAGKHPRPEHVAASGKPYDIAKGMFLEGRWTWPGVEINCRCVSVPIIPGA